MQRMLCLHAGLDPWQQRNYHENKKMGENITTKPHLHSHLSSWNLNESWVAKKCGSFNAYFHCVFISQYILSYISINMLVKSNQSPVQTRSQSALPAVEILKDIWVHSNFLDSSQALSSRHIWYFFLSKVHCIIWIFMENIVFGSFLQIRTE